MSRNKIHSDGVSVPFKWEKHPGISKVSSTSSSMMEELESHGEKLPPPPCRVKKAVKAGASTSVEDPFLMALKKCTKSKKSSSAGDHRKHLEVGFGLIRKNLLRVSCKHSIGVRDDAFTQSRY